MQTIKTNSKISLMTFLLLISSCAHKNDSAYLNEINSSLTNAKKLLQENTALTCAELEDKTHRPATAERAIIWLEKAQKARAVTKNASDKLERLKTILTLDNSFIKNNELLETLNLFKSSITKIDSGINKVFYKKVNALTNYTRQYFADTLFNDNNKAAGVCLLTKFQTDVAMLENNVVMFCNNQVGNGRDMAYDKFSIILGQSTNHLKSGYELIISGGVGAFSATSNPIFIIEGKTLKADENGIFQYRTKRFGNSGKRIIPVEII